MKRLLDGALLGAGFVAVVAVAVVIAWAPARLLSAGGGEVFTVDKDGALKFAVNDQGKITVGATESYVNLVIQNNAAAANDKVDITADVLTVEGIRLENVNVSADLTLSGAGGLDTGSEAANTWYYVWVLTNNAGTSTNGLLSTSSTAPTMPSGFTKKRRVGAVRNDASSNFLKFVQEGTRVLYLDSIGDVLVNGNATVFTTVGAGSGVPPTSKRAYVRQTFSLAHSTAGTAFAAYLRKTGSGVATGAVVTFNRTQVANQSVVIVPFFDLDLDDSQQFDYKMSAAPDSGGITIRVQGYYDRI